jgi:hypothetical protein
MLYVVEDTIEIREIKSLIELCEECLGDLKYSDDENEGQTREAVEEAIKRYLQHCQTKISDLLERL